MRADDDTRDRDHTGGDNDRRCRGGTARAPSGSEQCGAAPDVQVVSPGPRTRGHRAHRLAAEQLPWPYTLKMRDGTGVDLLNISTSGILIESSLKFAPKSTTEFQLLGPDTTLTLPVRFVRSSVSAVDTLGVHYQAAAVFSRKVELFSSLRGATPTSAATPQALAQLLVRVTSELTNDGTAADLRTTFEQGWAVVPGCAIKRRTADGFDKRWRLHLFMVPSTTGARASEGDLRPEYRTGLCEFKLRGAAAAVAAVLVQFEEQASRRRLQSETPARSGVVELFATSGGRE